MALRQVACSVQNDGNFCQLDLRDEDFGGPLQRIETYRCSHPSGGDYGATVAGTPVAALAGADHLTPTSNRIFRHVFSVGLPHAPKITLEMRETFQEDGSCEGRVRDLDPDSETFGRVLIISVRPTRGNTYELHCAVTTKPTVRPTLVSSPLHAPVTELVPGLPDLSADVAALGGVDTSLDGNPLKGSIHWPDGAPASQRFFQRFVATLASAPFATWARNVQVYERFGDFRDKCVHPGTNLRGVSPQLASEYMMIRAYRIQLIFLGPLFDHHNMSSMAAAGESLFKMSAPLTIDPKPGVYAIFWLAYLLNIDIYQLGLDKVHSDYGGVPMVRSPGSRMENGATPIVDATRLNRAMAELAFAFYGNPDLPALRAIGQASTRT